MTSAVRFAINNSIGLLSVGITTFVGYEYYQFKNFFSKQFEWLQEGEWGESIGKVIGDNLQKAANGAADSFNAEDVAQNLADKTVHGTFKGFMKGANFSRMAEEIHSNVSDVAKELFGVFTDLRKMTTEEFSQMASDFGTIVGNGTRTLVLKNLPWVVLGSVVTLGTPLAIKYIYHRAIRNLDEPTLAQEKKSYNLIDRATDAVKATANWMTVSVSTYFKYTFFTVTSAYISLIAPSITYGTLLALNLVDESKMIDENLFIPTIKSLDVALCNIFSSLSKLGLLSAEWKTPNCSNFASKTFINNENIFLLGVGIGLGAMTYKNLVALGRFLYNLRKKDPKPIFNAQLQERLDEIVQSIKNLRKHGGYLPNIMLYGPGGTGKTMISKYIARNSKVNYLMMSGGDLAQFIKKGSHVSELNKIMQAAKSSNGPTIIFIDECESLCQKRENMTNESYLELINAFLNQTGEPDFNKNVMLVLATNEPDLDQAVLSRMDYKVSVQPPEAPERRKILEMYLRNSFSSYEIKTFFTQGVLERITEETKGMTGRTIFKMINALVNKKRSTKNNQLTEEMIEQMVHNFVNQEVELEKIILESRAKRQGQFSQNVMARSQA